MDEGHWLFGYGSLMWAPDFPVAEQVIAQADGWRRSFCLRSIRHRGTAEQPGLVLGLEAAPGHLCTGLALRVEDAGLRHHGHHHLRHPVTPAPV